MPGRASTPEGFAGRALWTAILEPDAPPVPYDDGAHGGASGASSADALLRVASVGAR